MRKQTLSVFEAKKVQIREKVSYVSSMYVFFLFRRSVRIHHQANMSKSVTAIPRKNEVGCKSRF